MAPGGTTPWPATPVDSIAAIGLSMDSGGAADAAAKLRAAMQSIANAAAVYERIVQSLAEHLEGDAAEAARAGARRVAQAAIDNATNAGRVGGQLDDVAAILGTGRSAAEAGAAQVRTATRLSGGLKIVDVVAASQIKAELDSTMDHIYSTPMVGTHSQITMPAAADLTLPGRLSSAGPHTPTDSGSAAAAFSHGGTTDAPDTGGTPGMLAAPHPASAYRPATSSAATDLATPLAQTDAPVSDSGPPTAGPSAPLGVPGTSSGGPGAGPSVPARGFPVAAGPSGTIAGRTTGSLAPIAAAPTSRVTGPVVSGRPVGALPTPAAAQTTPRNGVPPATAPAARAGTKANEHHRAASYLRGRHHSETAIGPLPLVAPPVLGDWAEPEKQAAGDSDSNQGDRR